MADPPPSTCFGNAVCSGEPRLESLVGAAFEATGGSSGAWEEVLRCGDPATNPQEHRREALGGCSDRLASGCLVPPAEKG